MTQHTDISANTAHPTDAIPAFVLGVLGVDEAMDISTHIAQCPQCRGEVDSFMTTISLIPYAEPSRGGPRAAVKQRLMTRISSDLQPVEVRASPTIGVDAVAEVIVAAVSHPPVPAPDVIIRPPRRSLLRFVPLLTTLLLAIGLGLGLIQANGRAFQLEADLAAARQQLLQRQSALAAVTAQREADLAALDAQLREQTAGADQLARTNAAQAALITSLEARVGDDTQLISFIGTPNTVSQTVMATELANSANALIFMQPGHRRVAIVAVGLPLVDGASVYRLWLSKDGEAVAVADLRVATDGSGQLVADAPLPMDEYGRMMITLEREYTSARPSDVVLFDQSL